MSSVQSLNRARAFHLKLNRFWKPVSFCHKSGPRLQEIHSLARSLTHSLTFFHPHINPPTRSHTAHPLTRSQTHSLTYSLTHSLNILCFFFFSTNRLKGSFLKKKKIIWPWLFARWNTVLESNLRRQYRWSNWSSQVLTCKVVVKISVRIGAIRSTVWSSCLSPHTILKWVKVNYLKLETCMPI